MRLRELARRKQQAIEREDYDEAKKLKSAITGLKQIGSRISELERRKREAVEREDCTQTHNNFTTLDLACHTLPQPPFPLSPALAHCRRPRQADQAGDRQAARRARRGARGPALLPQWRRRGWALRPGRASHGAARL